MSLILCYCEKCGQHYDASDKELFNLKNIICVGCCETGYFKPIPKEYLNNGGWGIKKELQEQFIDNIVKSSPNFDQECWNRREAFIEIQKHNEELLENDRVKRTNVPKCPICQSTNLTKISLLKKAAKIGVLGILGAIDDAGKTYKCGNCGSKF